MPAKFCGTRNIGLEIPYAVHVVYLVSVPTGVCVGNCLCADEEKTWYHLMIMKKQGNGRFGSARGYQWPTRVRIRLAILCHASYYQDGSYVMGKCRPKKLTQDGASYRKVTSSHVTDTKLMRTPARNDEGSGVSQQREVPKLECTSYNFLNNTMQYNVCLQYLIVHVLLRICI